MRHFPQIIRGGRSVEAVVAPPPVRLEGWFTVELIHAKTGLIKRRLRFRNLITDAGLNAIGNGTQLNNGLQWIAVGTGSTAPANAQTTLVTEFTPQTRTNYDGGIADVPGVGAANAYWYVRRTRVFTEAQVNGNLTELGWFTASSGGTMFVRQLFKDAVGTPTVITKTAADQLRITYEWRIYTPTADVVQAAQMISGVSTDVTTRGYKIDGGNPWGDGGLLKNLGGWFTGNAQGFETNTLVAAAGASMGGTNAFPTSIAYAAYVAGNFYRDCTIIFDPAIANFATGVGGLTHFDAGPANDNPAFQTVFNPKIAKTSVKRLTIVMRHSFGRYP